MARRKRIRYSPEFKVEALRAIQDSGASIEQVSRDLGVTAKTLHNWLKATRPAPREPLTEDERAELVRLRRDNRRLQMERDILKKATAFFAKYGE
jgi:transposase